MSNPEVDVVEQIEVAEGALGQVLRQARENQNLTLEDAAQRLNLKTATLELLEQERYEDLPGTTFVRGYIRAYGNLLGLDGEALAKQCRQVEAVKDNVKPLQNLERKSRSKFVFVSFLLLLVVIAALAGYWWMEQRSFVEPEEQTNNASMVLEKVVVEGADGALHIQSLDELQAQTDSMAVEEVLLPETGPVLNTNAEEESSTDEAVSVTNISASDVLELSFIQDCWIRITDAQGGEVVSGLKRAGEVITLEGAAPFELHLGYAPGVLISFNGQQIDFDSKIRGNVARIKLG